MKHNYEHFDPPLSSGEAGGVIKAVAKKEYAYTCKQAPICNYCEKTKCLKRAYGVGGGFGGNSIEIDSITKYETESRSSVRWYVEMQGERIEVTTDQLLEQRKLQRLCVEKLNKCPSIMPQPRWENRINELLTVVEVINDPDDASPRGQFEKVLDAFLTGKVQARHRDEIMNAKPWHDVEAEKVYFRSEDLFIYLEGRRFRFHSHHQIWSWLREAGGDRNQFRIKGKAIKVWSVPAPEFYEEEPLGLPPTIEDDF